MAKNGTAYDRLTEGLADDLSHETGYFPQNSYYRVDGRKYSYRLYQVSIVNLILLAVQILLLGGFLTKDLFLQSGKNNDGQLIQKTYGSNEKYMSLDHQYDFLWESPAIQKAGVIALSRDDEGNVVQIGAISMFHQLHCLVSFRKALQKAYNGEKVAFDFNEDQHWPHCLYYLREVLHCRADDQIESQRVWNGSIPFVDGASDIRQCRDPMPLYERFNKERVSS